MQSQPLGLLISDRTLKREADTSQIIHSINTLSKDSYKRIPPQIKKIKVKVPAVQNIQKISYKDIQECPTYNLTYQEMMGDPIVLFKRLEQQYQDFGAIKLKACEQWNPPYSFRYVDKKLTTRIQNLSDLRNGKAFQQKIESYSVKEYQQFALNFQNKYQYLTNPTGDSSQEKRQQEFWSLITNPQYDRHKVRVQYAADLPVSKYGSGFPQTKHFNVPGAQMEYDKNLFNLNNIFKSKQSLLRIIKNKSEKISGVTSPWMYLGMQFSSFCWHIEDLYINSLNYNHLGSTKTWYVVPKSDKDKFDAFAKIKLGKLLESKPDMLHRITLMMDPLELIRNGIKVRKINQQQRCYVLTFSKAYHSGFSHGFNVGQAVNFVTTQILDDVKQADEAYRLLKGKKASIFPFEWLIFENCRKEYLSQLSDVDQKLLLQQRDSITAIESKNIDKAFKQLEIKQYMFLEPKLLKYDKNICSGCKVYCYLSFIQCKKCSKKYCLLQRNKCCQDVLRIVLRPPESARSNLLTLLNINGLSLIESSHQ